MPFNGSGVFTNPFVWVNDKANGIPITASRFDTQDGGIATGLSTCITKDGQQTTTALIPFAVGLSVNQGTVGAPSISIAGNATTGLYQSASTELDFASAGVRTVSFTSTGIDNTVIGGTTPAAGKFTTGVFSNSVNFAQGADIASATTTDIGAATGNFVNITGTTTITGLGTVQAGTLRWVKFAGILTLTYNGTSLILPTGASITTAAGDTALFVSLGSGNWRCLNYNLASGAALVAGSAGALTLLATNAPSGAASTTFSSTFLTATYNNYLIIADSIKGSAANADLLLTMSQDNGSTYIATNYQWGGSTATTGATLTGVGNASAANVNLTGGATPVSSTVAVPSSLVLYLYKLSSTSGFTCRAAVVTQAGELISIGGGNSSYAAGAINNIKLALSTGNITGNFHLYGISGT